MCLEYVLVIMNVCEENCVNVSEKIVCVDDTGLKKVLENLYFPRRLVRYANSVVTVVKLFGTCLNNRIIILRCSTKLRLCR